MKKLKNFSSLLMASLLVLSSDALHARDEERAFRGDGHGGGLPHHFIVADDGNDNSASEDDDQPVDLNLGLVNDDSDNSGSEDDQPLGPINHDSDSEEEVPDNVGNQIPLANQDILETLSFVASQIPQDYSEGVLEDLFPTNFDAIKQREYMNQILQAAEEVVMGGDIEEETMNHYQNIYFYRDALEAFINGRN